MKIVGICGSLKKDSLNKEILKYLKDNSPRDFIIYDRLDLLPIFNPSTELEFHSDYFDEIKINIKECDYVLFSTPEYIHSIPGGLKNFFDWIVGSGVLDKKKSIVIIGAASEGQYAFDQMLEIVNVLTDNNVLLNLSFQIQGVKSKFTDRKITDQATIDKLNLILKEIN